MKQAEPLLVDHQERSSTFIGLQSVDKTLYSPSVSYDSTKHLPQDLDSDLESDPESAVHISSKNKLLGTACCIISIISWVAQAHSVKDLQHDIHSEEYAKPFFIMYLCGVSLVLIYPIWYCKTIFYRYKYESYIYIKSNSSYQMFKTLFLPSIIVAFLFLCVEYLAALSLNGTMVSVNMSLFQSEIAFTYILSVLFLGMKVKLQKILGVIVCIGGVAVIAFNEEVEEEEDQVTTNTTNGIILILMAAVISASMNVCMEYIGNKYFDKHNSTQDMLFLQILIGFVHLLLFWPFFFILDAANVENFELPSNKDQWISIVLTMVFALGFWGFFFLAIALTSAMFAAVVIVFVVPVGYFSDVIIYQYIPNIWAFIGTLWILIGFFLIELPVFDSIMALVKKPCMACKREK